MASAYVQGTSAGATASAATSVNVTFAGAVTAGNHAICDGTAFKAAAIPTVSSVADNKANGNYTSAIENTYNANVRNIQYFKNNLGTGGTTFTVTITWSASCDSSISVHEISGVSTTAPTTNSNSATGTAVTSGAANPGSSSYYHAVMSFDSGSSPTVTNNAPWTERSRVNILNTVQDHLSQDQVATTGSQNASWTITSSPWGCIIAAYPDAGGGGAAQSGKLIGIFQAVNRASTY